MQRLDIAGDHQRDPPPHAFAEQPGVDQVGILAADHHGDVARLQECVAALQLRSHGMAAPYRERVAVGIEQLAMKSLEGVADADHQIDGTGEFGGEDRRPAPGHDFDPDAGRSFVEPLHQRRHQQFDREVRHHQAEMPFAARGIEIVGNEQPAHLVERLRQRPAQRLRARRQFHPRADAHQQRIVEHVAQPLQRMARGRLRQPDPHRGAADIGLQQQGVEGDQQVEIERG